LLKSSRFKEGDKLFIIIPFIVIFFLELVVEPLFKVRVRTVNKFGALPTVLISGVITFLVWYVLTLQYPTVDTRIFTFSLIGIMVYLIPKKQIDIKG
jgi:hypothetical protein